MGRASARAHASDEVLDTMHAVNHVLSVQRGGHGWGHGWPFSDLSGVTNAASCRASPPAKALRRVDHPDWGRTSGRSHHSSLAASASDSREPTCTILDVHMQSPMYWPSQQEGTGDTPHAGRKLPQVLLARS